MKPRKVHVVIGGTTFCGRWIDPQPNPIPAVTPIEFGELKLAGDANLCLRCLVLMSRCGDSQIYHSAGKSHAKGTAPDAEGVLDIATTLTTASGASFPFPLALAEVG